MKLLSTLRYRRLVLAGMLLAVLSSGTMVQIFSNANAAPSNNTPAPTGMASNEIDKESGKPVITTASGLKYVELVVGTGAAAKAGDHVFMNYVGKLSDGTVFDASAKHGGPFDFVLGTGSVIKGWDEGVAGIKIGGKRKLIIPPQLGYGMQGAGGVIPPNATLTFETELVSIKSN